MKTHIIVLEIDIFEDDANKSLLSAVFKLSAVLGGFRSGKKHNFVQAKEIKTIFWWYYSGIPLPINPR